MSRKRNLYKNKSWYDYAQRVKHRDDYKCTTCGRSDNEVVLQVHHTQYKPNHAPWEYPLSDCITLCRGCHAREHNIVEPNRGWTLLEVDDLGDLIGVCERNGCGNDIRYEHNIYHPSWGYKSVGSTCVEYLTEDDKALSHKVLKIYKNISEFINNSKWHNGTTKRGIPYLHTSHNHSQIRIYGKPNRYSFQILLKNKGMKWYTYKDFVSVKTNNLDQVKELGYIMLKGLTTESESEKDLLRELYRKVK